VGTPVQIVPEGLSLLAVEISSVFWVAIQNTSTTPSTLQVWNSTDGGATWAQVGSDGADVSLGWNGNPIPAVFDGDHTFTFFFVDNSTGFINLQRFDLNAGDFGAVFATQDLSPMVPVAEFLAVLSTGEFLAVYADDSNNPLSIYAQIWNGSSWSAPVKVSTNAEGATSGSFGPYVSGVLDSGDVLHLIFYAEDAGPPFHLEGVFYQEVTAALALQNYQQFPDNVGASPDVALGSAFPVQQGPAPGMLILGSSIYWAVPRINYGSGNPTYISAYVGTPVLNPVWTELGNLDPGNPGSGATCPGLFYDAASSLLYLAYLAADGSGPCRGIVTADGFADVTAFTLYDDTMSGPTLFRVDCPLLIFTPSFIYLASGSAPEEGPTTAAYFTPVTPPTPLDADCNNPPSGIVGIPYTHTFDASGGTPPYTFSISSGSLPPGLSLDDSTGIVSGTPTTAGNYPFALTVTDSASGTVTVNCSITIVAALGSVKITLRGVKLRCKPQDEPNFQQVPQLPGVKRAM